MKKGYRYNSTAQFQAYQQIQYANFNAAAAAGAVAPNMLQRGAQWVGKKVLTPFQMNLRRKAASAGKAANAIEKDAFENASKNLFGQKVMSQKAVDDANQLYSQATQYGERAAKLGLDDTLQRRVGYGVAGAGALGLGAMGLGVMGGNKQQQPMY